MFTWFKDKQNLRKFIGYGTKFLEGKSKVILFDNLNRFYKIHFILSPSYIRTIVFGCISHYQAYFTILQRRSQDFFGEGTTWPTKIYCKLKKLIQLKTYDFCPNFTINFKNTGNIMIKHSHSKTVYI